MGLVTCRVDSFFKIYQTTIPMNVDTLIEEVALPGVKTPSTKENVKEDIKLNGRPVYLFRSLFNEMSLLGSDLMVEPFDGDDF